MVLPIFDKFGESRIEIVVANIIQENFVNSLIVILDSIDVKKN